MNYFFIYITMGGSLYDVVSYMLDYNIVVSQFELWSHYYVHFQTNTREKGMNPLTPSYVLNSTTTGLVWFGLVGFMAYQPL